MPRLGYSVQGVAHFSVLTALTALATATYLQCVFCDPGELPPACAPCPFVYQISVAPNWDPALLWVPHTYACPLPRGPALHPLHTQRACTTTACRPRARRLAARCGAGRRGGAAGQAAWRRAAVRKQPLGAVPNGGHAGGPGGGVTCCFRTALPAAARTSSQQLTCPPLWASCGARCTHAPPPPRWCRYCKKCAAHKPPRTHHCRRCGCCILRMDHHW